MRPTGVGALAAREGEVRDGVGVQRPAAREAPLERPSESLASPLGQRLDLRSDRRHSECGAKLSRAFEA